MSRTSRAIKGTLTSFLQFGLQIVLQALLAPLVLRVIGQETLGAYAVLLQAIGYIALVDFGFAAAANRYLAQACGFDDGGLRLGQVMSTFRTYALFIHIGFLFTVHFALYLDRSLIVLVNCRKSRSANGALFAGCLGHYAHTPGNLSILAWWAPKIWRLPI